MTRVHVEVYDPRNDEWRRIGTEIAEEHRHHIIARVRRDQRSRLVDDDGHEYLGSARGYLVRC